MYYYLNIIVGLIFLVAALYGYRAYKEKGQNQNWLWLSFGLFCLSLHFLLIFVLLRYYYIYEYSLYIEQGTLILGAVLVLAGLYGLANSGDEINRK